MKKYITIAALLAAGTAIANATIAVDVNSTNFGITRNTATCNRGGLTFTITTSSSVNLFNDGQFNSTAPDKNLYYDNVVLNDPTNAWGKDFATTFIYAGSPTAKQNLTVKISGYAANQSGIDLSFITGVPFEGAGQWASAGSLSNSFSSGSVTWAAKGSTTSTVHQFEGNSPYAGTVGPFSPVVYTYSGVTASELGEISFTIKAAPYHSAGISGIKATLSNVPEPSAFGLLAGIGALALVASRRRRK